MLKLIRYSLLAVAVLLATSACKKTPNQSDELEGKKKAFQEQQKAKAAQAYRDLIEKYPDSEFTADAKKRLEALGPIAAPKSKATPGK